MCLDRTEAYQASSCQKKEKPNRLGKCTAVGPDGKECLKSHNRLLNGSKIAYFNALHIIGPARGQARHTNLLQGTIGSTSTSTSSYAVPTMEEITSTDIVHALVPLQYVKTPLEAGIYRG